MTTLLSVVLWLSCELKHNLPKSIFVLMVIALFATSIMLSVLTLYGFCNPLIAVLDFTASIAIIGILLKKTAIR